MATGIDKGTISIQLVNEALLELQCRGAEVRRLMLQAGIAPELLGCPGARVGAEQYAKLWRLVAAVMDDEFFGMNARRMKCGSFAFIARSALREASVGDALEAILRFVALVFDDLRPRLQRHGELAEVVLDEPPGRACRAFAYFTLWMIVHGLTCWLAGRRIPIRAVELRAAEPAYTGDYRVMFSHELRFGQACSRLLFDAEGLDQPVRRTPQELKRFLAGAPGNILVRYHDPESLAARVRAHLRSLPPTKWPDLDSLSRVLYMAPSTLRRKLGLEGQSYQGLKDQLRRELALARLETGGANAAELGFELGFADTSAFYKAFRKWTGTTPGQYRASRTETA